MTREMGTCARVKESCGLELCNGVCQWWKEEEEEEDDDDSSGINPIDHSPSVWNLLAQLHVASWIREEEEVRFLVDMIASQLGTQLEFIVIFFSSISNGALAFVLRLRLRWHVSPA